MGPYERCVKTSLLPPPQPFQYPLPSPPATLADFGAVRSAIKSAMVRALPVVLRMRVTSARGCARVTAGCVLVSRVRPTQTTSSGTLTPDKKPDGSAYYGAVFVHLAFQCSSTFRQTDYLGGCNGARIRFPPQTTWSVNTGLDKALSLLDGVKTQFGTGLSYADLIVLAGTVALEQATGTTMAFCGGRTDASDGSGAAYLASATNYNATIQQVQDTAVLMGLSTAEWVVLQARPRSAEQMGRVGYSGSWNADPSTLSNAYFTTLLTETWQQTTSPAGNVQYQAAGKQLFMTPMDLALRWDPTLMSIAQMYAADNTLFLSDFAVAWTKVMNADRFDGPVGNVCAPSPTPTPTPHHSSSSGLSKGAVAGISIACTAAVMAIVFIVFVRVTRKSGGGDDDHRKGLLA